MRKKSGVAVELSNISKRYEIHHEKPTLVEKFINGKNETFWALQDISLTIRKGERVGIIGNNGSGKTTLLKIIAGISTPSSGNVSTNGRVVSLIDLEAGFHPDLSGINNIYLNGMLLGMSKSEISSVLTSIIRFADIRQFIDSPLYMYSQGMKLRLGFSVAIHANPDILLLDEATAVGDLNFQKKAQHKLFSLFHKHMTIVVVSHWMDFVKNICHRFILLDNGRILKDGQKNIISNYTGRI